MKSTWWKSAAIAGSLAAVLVLAACGSDPTPTPRPTATPVPTPTPAPVPTPTPAPGATTVPTPRPAPGPTPTPTVDPIVAFQPEWEALIAAAQAEGELFAATAGGSATRNFRPILEAFSEKYGIEATVSTGGGRATADRILAERAAGKYTVDIIHSGGNTAKSRFVPNGVLVPIAPLLVHPEVTDLSNWYQQKHWWTDLEQKYVFAYSASGNNYNLGMRYNTDLVTQADIDAMRSVYDFLDPKWKGQIVTLSPSYLPSTMYTAYVHPDVGPEWITRFYNEMDVEFNPEYRSIADGVSLGKFAMGVNIATAGGDIDELAEQGLPVARINKPFKERPILSTTSSSSNIVVVDSGPHPNAAKLYLNWFLSKEGQTLVHNVAPQPAPSLREDGIPIGNTDREDRRIPGVEYLAISTSPEFVSQTAAALEFTTRTYQEALAQR